MIPQRDLSLLSNRLARGGGRRIPEAVLEKDYCLSWFLVGMSATPLKAVVNRLLDEDDTSITLATLSRASLAVGIPLKIELQ